MYESLGKRKFFLYMCRLKALNYSYDIGNEGRFGGGRKRTI